MTLNVNLVTFVLIYNLAFMSCKGFALIDIITNGVLRQVYAAREPRLHQAYNINVLVLYLID